MLCIKRNFMYVPIFICNAHVIKLFWIYSRRVGNDHRLSSVTMLQSVKCGATVDLVDNSMYSVRRDLY